MQVEINILASSVPFNTKSGKQSHCAPCTFADEGARYPVGRGTVYSANPFTISKSGEVHRARLISYDRGEARFAL